MEGSCHDSTISVTQKEVLIKESILGFARGKGAESGRAIASGGAEFYPSEE